MSAGYVVNFADGNRDRANVGGFFRAATLSELFQIAAQLRDGGCKVWFDEPVVGVGQ